MAGTAVAPSLVPYDFVNVGIEEAFHKEGAGILVAEGEGKAMAEGPNCLCQPAFCLLDLMLKER